MQIPRLPLSILVVAATLLPPTVFAQANSQKIARSLVATCANCHGTDGKTVGTRLPRLAGQSEAALLASLKAFKDGSRPGTVMPQLVKGFTDQELAQAAAYAAIMKN